MFSASKTAAPVSGSFQVSNSLRFRSSATAYLGRTFGTPTDAYKWTWSGWLKLGAFPTSGYGRCIFSGGAQDSGNNTTGVFMNTSNKLYLNTYSGGSSQGGVTTSAVYRDPSAWYHCVFVYDSANATAADRFIIYVNYVRQETTGVLTQYTVSKNNANGVVNRIGMEDWGTSYGYDGYMAEINFIDGQALTPSSFGSINATTGVWQPAKYTGSYGTNGFYLKFNNGTSTTTLGYDSSGNSNNWTTNNISLTAGSTYDWMIDSPTSYAGSSYGVGNYAVLNPLNKGSDITASDGNLSISWGGFNGHSIRDSIAMSAGQWYCELTMGTSSVTMGLIAQNISGVGSGSGWPGSSTFGVGGSYGYANSGNKYTNSTSTAYGASYTTGDVIGIAFDATAGTLTFYKNGSSQGTAFTGISGAYCFAIGYFGGSTGGTPAYANFGQRPFAYTPPTGYKSLCTQNLPAPAIQNGASYMAATLYTGNGATQSVANAVNGVSFQPDFVWIKGRSTATQDHTLIDSVRGISRRIRSNTTQAEVLESGFNVTAFNANGFTVVDDAAGDYNVNGAVGGTYSGAAQYVAWQWKAGGTAVTNTAGSITSSVSANTTAGFSVVTWTGTAASAATVGHGLGIAPSLVIIKQRNGSTYGWMVYHSAVGAGNYLVLNQTWAAIADSAMFNNTAPTSSVFTLSSGGDIVITNPSAGTMVAYCFAAIAGYSAFGSYTGNGSSDGPFVFLGFRPRYVMIKRTDATQNWSIVDTSRDTYNVANKRLFANLSDAEDQGIPNFLDILSNGFKCRDSNVSYNASGGNYIYAAFAENPFQNSLAR